MFNIDGYVQFGWLCSILIAMFNIDGYVQFYFCSIFMIMLNFVFLMSTSCHWCKPNSQLESQKDWVKLFMLIVTSSFLVHLRPPLKYCLFGIADSHYQQVG